MQVALPTAQATAVEEARFVQLGGIEQWITIRGANRNNPVLLILPDACGRRRRRSEYALSRARSESNAPAVSELQALGVPAPENLDQYLIMRRWLNRYLAPSDLQWISTQDALIQSALDPADRRAYLQGFRTMTGLSATVFSMDLPSLGLDFMLPFFLIEGSDDHIAAVALATSYFEKVDAPVKRIAFIEGAGHFAPMTHMQQFAAALRDDLRLLAR